MSGWDWLHAGLEVATYAQARNAQQNLAAMKTAAEIEAAQKFLVNAMRNFIFDIARDIQLAEENLTEHPQQVYVIAKSLDWRLKDSGLSPEVFSEFSDKDYVLKTQKTISGVITKASSALSPSQIEESDTAIKYITEMPALQEAIKAKSSWEQIDDTDDDWDDLQSEANSSKTKRNFGILGLVASPCLCLAFSASDTQSPVGPLLGGLILIAALVMIFGGNKNNPEYQKLKTQREAWQKNLKPVDTWKQITNMFGGDLSSAEFQKILDDRVAFLQPILGNEVQKFLTEG
jgi:hypothetical protein